MKFSRIGLFIDPKELKKHSHITIWGRYISKEHLFQPWTPIMRIPINKEIIKGSLIETYISLETFKEKGGD